MPLPIAGLVAGALRLLPIFKRKGVQAGATAAVVGLLGHQAEPLITSQNLIPVIDALSNLLIAVGTMGAIWKGRKPRRAARVRSGQPPTDDGTSAGEAP